MTYGDVAARAADLPRTRHGSARRGRRKSVGGDAGADAAPAEQRHPALHLAGGDRSAQGNDKVGLIVHDVERMRAEVDDLIPGTSQLRGSFLSADPQWSEAMPTRNLGSFLG